MNGVPLRWHPLMRDLGRPIAVALVLANLVLGILGLRFIRGGGDALPWVTATVWLGPAVHLLLLGWRGRAIGWELALPITPRDLWRRHLLALTASSLLVWFVMVAVIWLMFGLGRMIGGTWPHDPMEIMTACLLGGAGLIPLAVWSHGRRPEFRLIHVSGWVDVVASVVIVIIAVAALHRPLLALMTLVAVTVGLGARSVAKIPRAWSVRVSASEIQAGSDSADIVSARWRWSMNLRIGALIYRSAPRGIMMALFMFPMVLLFGLLIGGGAQRMMPETEMRLLFLPMTAYVLLAGSAFPMAGLRAVDSLPFGRNRLLTLMLMPYVVILLAGYLGGAVWSSSTRPEGEQILFVDEAERYRLLVSLGLFELESAGDRQIVTAPWGESHEMMTVPVFGMDEAGGGPRLWKPYTVPRGASRQYAGWQLARAVEALHGKIFDPVELAEQYFVVNPDGEVAARGGALTFAADHPDLKNRMTTPMLPAVLGLLGILWLLPLAAFLNVCRARHTIRRRKTVLWSLMGVLLLLHILSFMSPILGWFDPDRFEAAAASGLRQLTSTLPAGAFLLWISTLFILAVGSWLVARSFRVLEADHAACSVCLLDANVEGRS